MPTTRLKSLVISTSVVAASTIGTAALYINGIIGMGSNLDMNGNNIVEALSVSGTTLRAGGNRTRLNTTGVLTVDTVSGSSLRATGIGTASGNLILTGSRGGSVCVTDSDDSQSFTRCRAINGAWICDVATSCP